jgi:ubiquinone/menaquinone biosynthesis C-methylase UbiE
MKAIKTFLWKWPAFYCFLQGIYYCLRKVLETQILGTKVQEWIWRNRELFYEMKDAKSGFLESLSHPHRRFLIRRILFYSPIENALEIGCDSGVNLCLLALEKPDTKLYGIDINKKVIEKGRNIIEEMGINNVFLSCGRADSLGSFCDKSVDVVFTDAVLMYIGPDRIYSVIGEIIRVARKAIIFNEWHIKSPDGRKYIYGHWAYDYQLLLSRYFSPGDVKITKITRELWDNDEWSSFGHVIELNTERLPY